MEPDQLFFTTDSSPHHAEARDLPAGYQVEFWAPRGVHFRPAGFGLMPFAFWGVFHHGRIFRNRGYQLLLIRKGDEVVHRSCIFPGYFRFPFMAAADLQVGDTWTSPTERGKGLAGWALAAVIRRSAAPGAKVWYICDQYNAASMAVARKAGMKLVGRGVRTRRFGLNLLGKFEILDCNSGQNP